MVDIMDVLNEHVNLRRLVRKLDFSEEEVERAAFEQPSLFYEAVRLRVQKMRDRVEANLKYQERYTRYSVKYRSRKNSGGQRKMTEGHVKDSIARKPEIRELQRKVEQAKVLEEFTALLVRTFGQRHNAIRVIVDARKAEGSVELGKMKEEKVRKKIRKLAKDVKSRYHSLHKGGDEDD